MDNQLKVDYYAGGNDVLLILTGLDGSTKGYQDKYVSIANLAVVNHNKTVFVFGTPLDAWSRAESYIEDLMQYILSTMNRRGLSNFDIFTMGHSAGGTFLLRYAYKYENIKSVIAINPVLNVSFLKTERGIESFAGKSIKVIAGARDVSFSISPMLESIKNPRFELAVIAGADHHFSGMVDEFIGLPELYLF